MADNLRKHIDSIRKLSSQLNTLSDELGKTVASVEEFLNVTCSLGIPSSVLVEEDDESHIRIHLCYGRVGGKFRIAVGLVFDDGEENTKPWSDCTRDVKIATFKKLPDLLAKIAQDI